MSTQQQRRLNQNRIARRIKLRGQVNNNQHEVVILSLEQLKAVIDSSPQRKAIWEKYKHVFEAEVNYIAPGLDLVTATKLVADLGAVNAKVVVKTYSGKQHIIIKGLPGIRKVFTAAKYGVTNPKVIQMGLGTAGAVNAVKQGGIITIILLTTYRVADYFLTDNASLTQLFGSLATDIVKVGIATGVSIGVAIMAGASSFALGPLAAVIFVGLATTVFLDFLDKKHAITEKLIVMLDDLCEESKNYINEQKQQIKIYIDSQAEKAINSVVNRVVDQFRFYNLVWSQF